MEGRHTRTIMGAFLMFVSVGLGVFGLYAAKAAPEHEISVLEVVHIWLYPVLLFMGGLALFHRESYKDIVDGGRRLIRRRDEDK